MVKDIPESSGVTPYTGHVLKSPHCRHQPEHVNVEYGCEAVLLPETDNTLPPVIHVTGQSKCLQGLCNV
jgi:hypothetical protein